MRFKRLEIIGFKSFAVRTVLDFEPGVTAIVGPNGCGKSNVSDAIKWVLGEQSARSLRGSRMEDVIFNGTIEREPIGMAEVSLTLSDADNLLPVDYNEVTVTRQLFRSGESRYLLNRTPCRLKDISELFMNTGLGASEYSIIEQGKIDMVLNSKPEERRVIFEEAAGITKYKAKKKEALRKLESTEENLIRLDDIIREVKRQINSIKRQVSKAQRYKELYSELSEVETAVSLVDYKMHIDEIERLQEESDGIRGEVDAGAAELRRLEGSVTDLRRRNAEYEQRIGEVQGERIELQGKIDAARTSLESNRSWIEEISRSTARGTGDLEDINRRIGELEGRWRVVEGELNTISGRCDSLMEKADGYEAALRDLDEAISAGEGRMEKARGETLEMQSRMSVLSNRNGAMRARRREIALAKRRAAVETEDAAARKGELEMKLSGEKAALERIREELGAMDRGRERVEAGMAGRGNIINDTRKEVLALEKELSRVCSKAELVRELNSPLLIDEILNADGGLIARVVGVISDLIEVKEGYADAVGAALSDRYADLVTDGFESSCDIARVLDRRCIKTVGLSHIGEGGPEHEVLSKPVPAEGARAALDVVVADERVKGLIGRLLGSVLIVDDMEAALALWAGCGGVYDIATRRGDYISAGGRIVLGGPGPRGGWISRQLEELEGEKALLEEKLVLAGKRGEEAESASSALAEEIKVIQSDLRRLEVERYSGERDIARFESEVIHSKEEELALSSQLEDLDEELRVLGENESKIEAEMDGCRREQDELERIIASSQKDVNEKGSEKEAVALRLGDVRVDLATLMGSRSNIEVSHREICTALEERKKALAARIGDVDTTKTRIKSLLSENESLVRRLEELETRKADLDGEVATISSERGRIRSLVEADDEKQRGLKERLDELRERQKNLDIRIAGLRPEAEGILQRVREEYGIILTERLHEVPAAAEGLVEKRSRIMEIKEKIKRIGPVNLGAIVEHDELSERYSFLEEQKKDLVDAKDALNKAILKINQTTRKMFSETFEAIRVNFREIYQILFGGGSADLVLLDESDILESGIDILARPPGKKLQSISLLSGGEKAMTAIALLFALFRVRPSPFCVLDEIDAPLDEANINRFVDLLAEFIRDSQFIVITHNKRTIGMADLLYGITMEESGISRVVSVKFTKEKEKSGVEG